MRPQLFVYLGALIVGLVATQAPTHAQDNYDCDWERVCTAAEVAEGSCLTFYEGGTPVWTIRVDAGCDGLDRRTPVLGVNYPAQNHIDGTTEWRYLEGAVNQSASQPALSYNVFRLTPGSPDTNDPNGADAKVKDVKNCTVPTASGTLWKINANVNSTNDGQIMLGYTTGGPVTTGCMNAYAIWSGQCADGLLWGPTAVSAAPATASYNCGDTTITITFGTCRSTITDVSSTSGMCTHSEDGLDVIFGTGPTTTERHSIAAVGGTTAFVQCLSGAYSAVVALGSTADTWWCQ